jgi:hypothetical protein
MLWPSLILVLGGLVALLVSTHFRLGTISSIASVIVMGLGGLVYLASWATSLDK